jgi:hypothetical protein
MSRHPGRLRARREELQRLSAAHGVASDPVEVDQARVGRLSRMDALQSQAMAAEVERRREVGSPASRLRSRGSNVATMAIASAAASRFQLLRARSR